MNIQIEGIEVLIYYMTVTFVDSIQLSNTIHILNFQANSTIAWDIVVGGWDLEYSVEFVPNAQDSYIVEVEKPRRIEEEEDVIHNSFTSRESGKLVLSVDNSASRKKKVAAYRYIVRKSISSV